jgi:arylsulfatase A-like enzyme
MYLAKGKESELYDLEADPEQTKNVIAEHPEKARELELELRRFVSELR